MSWRNQGKYEAEKYYRSFPWAGVSRGHAVVVVVVVVVMVVVVVVVLAVWVWWCLCWWR